MIKRKKGRQLLCKTSFVPCWAVNRALTSYS